jgi:hypothetical protein
MITSFRLLRCVQSVCSATDKSGRMTPFRSVVSISSGLGDPLFSESDVGWIQFDSQPVPAEPLGGHRYGA